MIHPNPIWFIVNKNRENQIKSKQKTKMTQQTELKSRLYYVVRNIQIFFC